MSSFFKHVVTGNLKVIDKFFLYMVFKVKRLLT